ncbi:MAG: hypothetical protein ABUL49_00960, partial [bacterium]
MLEAIGGEEGCLKLATAFYAHVAVEPELRPLFPGKSFRCATEEFSAFLVQFLGGDEDKTQYRWWISLADSHARFTISEAQRQAWLRQMEATLAESGLERDVKSALLQFFAAISTYVLGGEGEAVKDPEMAERWLLTRKLDGIAADLAAGHDQRVLQAIGE